MFKLIALLLTLQLANFIHCHQNHAQQDQQNYQQNVNQGHAGDPMMNNINRDHVMEHLDGVINKPKEQMSIDEQNFYYFKLHDYDNNNVLDGLELVTAFAHNEGKLVYIKLV
jgi:hypothetical protein